MKRGGGKLRLILDAHASIAFLAGSVLDLKSGIQAQLVQKGRVGTKIWHADDAKSGPRFVASEEKLGDGSTWRSPWASLNPSMPSRAYVASNLPNVGKLLSFSLPGGPGQQSVSGGGHSAALAEQVSNQVRALKADAPDAVVHIFAACPNSLLFFLGQQHQGIAPCVVYEFDFDRRGAKTYQPSFIID